MGITAYIFLPTIMSYVSRKKNRVVIALVNILLGWTLIGWVVAAIWACMEDKENDFGLIVHSPSRLEHSHGVHPPTTA